MRQTDRKRRDEGITRIAALLDSTPWMKHGKRRIYLSGYDAYGLRVFLDWGENTPLEWPRIYISTKDGERIGPVAHETTKRGVRVRFEKALHLYESKDSFGVDG